MGFRQFLDDLIGPTPIVHEDIPHNEQNDDVFNSENSPPQDLVADESINPDGTDPFYGIHTQTVEEVTGHQAEEAHKDFKRGMAELGKPLFLSVRDLPSDDWAPRQVTLVDAGSYLLDGTDKDRLRITIINSSASTIFLSKAQTTGSFNVIPLPTNSSITINTRDSVWVNCPTATAGAPITFGVFTEK